MKHRRNSSHFVMKSNLIFFLTPMIIYFTKELFSMFLLQIFLIHFVFGLMLDEVEADDFVDEMDA